MNWEPTKTKLQDPDLKKGLEAVTELRDRIEIVHSPEYPNLLSALLPLFIEILKERTKPNSDIKSDEQKLRRAILEVLSRFPHNDTLKEYAPSLLECAMGVLTCDYEENAMVAYRIVFDLHHKNFRPIMAEQVQPFLDFVMASLRAMSDTVKNMSDDSAGTAGHTRSVSSFKILTECPLTVMLLFQLYPKFIKPNIPTIIPLMMEALALKPPPTFPEAKSRELVACQVKTLSFLTYLIRGFGEQMSAFKERIAGNIVNLMRSCPNDAISTRKELLVATRRILATDFRKGFYPHIDILFDERILIGVNYRQHSATSNNMQTDSLRPMGYSTLADLVHHVRSQLTLNQVSKVIYIFSRVIHDPSQPVSIQTTSARLLLNLVDHIFHSKESSDQSGRGLLVRILDTLVKKFGTLALYMNKVKEASEIRNIEKKESDNFCDLVLSASFSVEDSETKKKDDSKRIEKERSFALGGNPDITDSLEDIKMIVKPMIMGIKTVIWCIKNYNLRSQVGGKKGKSSSSSSDERQQLECAERDLVVEYLTLALPCLKVFKWKNSTYQESVDSNKQEFREVLEHFAASFTVLDSFDIQRTLGRRMQFLFEHMLLDPDLLTLPQHLIVSNMNVSYNFCEVLLAFLVTNMKNLSECDVTMYLIKSGSQTVDKMHSEGDVPYEARVAYTLLRLFKIVFQSLSLFPENEIVLRSYLQALVAKCLKLATQVEGPGNHFYLMLRLFRGIAGGKFEQSYKELLPLLPTILNSLYRIYVSTEDDKMRSNIVEIALAIPARLSSLYPHLPLLLRFILPALQCKNGDIVNLGLRTLEFWVDNLNPEYLYPILATQESEIMILLCNHLRPAPYPYGLLSLRLLGKLGGRNRKFLRGIINIPIQADAERLKLFIGCEWKNIISSADDGCQKSDEFSYSLPIGPALIASVELLRANALAPKLKPSPKPHPQSPDGAYIKVPSETMLPYPLELKDVSSTAIENADLTKHIIQVMEVSKRNQVTAAFELLRSIIRSLCEIDDDENRSVEINNRSCDSGKILSTSVIGKGQIEENALYHITKGLLFASIGEFSSEAKDLLTGLSSYLILWSTQHTVRLDESGSKISSDEFKKHSEQFMLEIKSTGTEEGKTIDGDVNNQAKSTSTSNRKVKLSPLSVFGFFGVCGSSDLNPFAFNQALVNMLCDPIETVRYIASKALHDFVDQVLEVEAKYTRDNGGEHANIGYTLVENLLFLLCQCCFDKAWNLNVKVFDAIYKVCSSLGLNWTKQFEVQVIQAVLFSVKSYPRELTSHLIENAFKFLVRMITFIYCSPYSPNDVVYDVLSVPSEFENIRPHGSYPSQYVSSDDGTEEKIGNTNEIPEMIVQMFVGELASPKHIVRFIARFCLKFISNSKGIPLSSLLSEFSILLKRTIFSRGLRYASLEDQIGIVDALTFVIEEAPYLYTLGDQNLLVHLSDLLRTATIVDGGKATDPGASDQGAHISGVDVAFKGCHFSSSRASAMFLRDESNVRILDVNVIIPAELPYGEQLRVSTLLLFRAVIRRHTKEFFSAESTATIGNIRSHVVNLLFRSLISKPTLAATVAFATLDFVIGIGRPESETKDIPALDKNLLNVCMKPVLFNLKDHQKLDVVLLEGMGRLLSLLSSMFNVTLGEKLLDHLKKWENPKGIIDHKVWKVGDEPLVAAAIINLFEFLPIRKPTNFVDKLINAVIRLETVLPQFKEFSSTFSPYREPLTRYLCRYPDVTCAFFLSEQKLGNPSYIELFLDILQNKEASVLRDFIGCKPLQVLRMCFERPISIIRAEKQQQTSKTNLSAINLLTLHGVTSGSIHQQAARRDLETKEKKMSIMLQAEQKAKSALQDAVNAKTQSSAVLQTLKTEHQKALSAYNSSQRDVTAAKSAAAKLSVDGSGLDLPCTPMTIDALEWQYQGMRIIEVLVENDSTFFEGTNHADVFQIYRLLWKSNGRHLRMIHEDRLPYKLKSESKFIAMLLVTYSKHHSDDIDILIDLLRIFISPSGIDFTFVRSFLEDSVTQVLSIEQKKKLLQRFFLVIGSDGNDESKVLCLQLLILPLLREGLRKENTSIKLVGGRPPTRGSHVYNTMSSPKKDEDDEKKIDKPERSRSELVDIDFIRKFMKDALLQDHKTSARSDRLNVELLKVATLFIEYLWEEMVEHRKELVKFTWNHLKTEDSGSKNWAYINICHFIKAFDTPSKIILQVYISLLRAHQADKDLIRASIDILIPALAKRLPTDDLRESVKWTKKIMFEEGHSISQLTHLWEIFIRHPVVFYPDRQLFVPHMVNSLNRLGLPPTSTLDNRILSLSVVNLIMTWDDHCQSQNNRSTSCGHRDKRKRTDDETSKKDYFQISQSMIEIILNFLVRIVLSNADSKDDGSQDVCRKGIVLFERGVKAWKYDVLRSTYFDKVFASCKEKVKASKEEKKSVKSKSSVGDNPDDGQSNSLSSQIESVVATESLVACLDLMVALVKYSPYTRFWEENVDKICTFIVPCFSRATSSKNGLLRVRLKSFLIAVLCQNGAPSKVLLRGSFINVVKGHMESIIVSGGKSQEKVESMNDSDKKNVDDNDPFDDVRCGGRFPGFFVIEVIDDVCKLNPSFLDNFLSPLLGLGQRLVKSHVQEVATSTRRVTSMNSQMISRGIQQCLATPMLGIIEEATDLSSGAISAANDAVLSDDRGMKEIEDIGTCIRSTIIIVRLLGSNNKLPISFDSDLRKRYFQLLSTILDKSDCISLLLTVVGIVGQWLVDPRSPITKTERIRFLKKFTFSQLTEVPGEPLANLVANIILEMKGAYNSKRKNCGRKRDHEERGKTCSSIIDVSTAVVSDDDSNPIESDVDHTVEQLTISHSLTADYDRRFELLQSCKYHNTPRAEQKFSKSCIADILIKVFRSDLDGLGEKLWLQRFVEQVIDSCSCYSNVGITCPPTSEACLSLPESCDKKSKNGYCVKDIPGYLEFYANLRSFKKEGHNGDLSLMRCVGKLAISNVSLCEHLFRHFVIAAWQSDEGDETRKVITESLETLLAQPQHSQFVYTSRFPFKPKTDNNTLTSSHGFNIIQCVIGTVLDLRPIPEIDVDLLVHIATNFNAWHQVIRILESNLISCSDTVAKIRIKSALRRCFSALGENDISLSIDMKTSVLPGTKKALSFELYGMVTEALATYNALISSDDLPVSDEVDIWEERFIDLYRETQQWSVLADYSKSSDNPSLMMECAWKARDWKAVQSLLPSPVIIAGLEKGDTETKINEIYLAIGNGKLGEVEKLHLQAVQLCLHKWQLLPSLSPSCNAHTALLQQFHRLVELRESGQIMLETRNHSTKGTLPDLKNLLSAWRNRLPNEYDPVSVWSDLLTWRSHIFSAITHNFQWSEPSALATLHDKPWTAIRMARAARKHNMKEVSLMSLGKLTDTAMDVSDAFVKLREQIVLCRDSRSPQEYQNGLNIVQTTNLSFFDEKQKSELFRLKATFFSLLKHKPQANQAFCHSIQICPNYGKSWLSWGEYCSGLSNHVEHKILTLGNEAKERVSLSKKSVQYLVQAMGCYLEAILCGNDDARTYLSHVLWMVRRDGTKAGILCETLERRGKLLPEWVWLPWIPQLLTSVGRIEGHAAKRILAGICVRYPQSIYYYLRTYYLERLDLDRLRSSASSEKKGISPTKDTTHTTSSTYAQELVNTLRKSHPGLWVSLESITDEFINRFRPSFEEELLTAISALLQRALPQKKKNPQEKDNKALFSSFSRTLNRVSAKFFRPATTVVDQNEQRGRKEIEFSLKFKEEFEKDFLMKISKSKVEPEKESAMIDVEELDLDLIITRLKKWREILLPQVSSLPSSVPLQHLSPSLAAISFDSADLLDMQSPSGSKSLIPAEASRELSSTLVAAAKSASAAISAATSAEANTASNSGVFSGIEIPGRYLHSAQSKPNPELHPKLVRFAPTVGILQRDGQAVRRIGLVASDGKTYYFGFQYVTPYSTWSGERCAQVHQLLDYAISELPMASSKNLSLRPNAVIPLAQKLRMTEESLDEISLAEIFTNECRRRNIDPESINSFYGCELSNIEKELSDQTESDEKATESMNKQLKETQLRVFNKICKEMVPDDILVTYIESRFHDSEAFFSFRKIFASQLAANCLLQYTFCASDRTPHKFVFNSRSGEVLSPDFQLSYSNRGLLEQKDLPFRFTRNLQVALGPTLLDGTFIPAMGAMASALSSKSSELKISLCLLLRDDIISWYASKSFARGESETQELERQLDPRITRNAELIISRFQECSPHDAQSKPGNDTTRVDSKLRDLIDVATSAETLCSASLSFQPWL